MKAKSICIFLFLIPLVSPPYYFLQIIETKDGVRLVHNEKEGKWGANPQVLLKLIRTIGGIEVEDENLAFNQPYDIAMDKNGNLYILDTGNVCIQKLSPEGKYIDTIGRQGQGPGEFQSPYSLDLDMEGYLYISDGRNRKIHILSQKGKLHKTVKIKKYRVHLANYVKPGLIAVGGLSRFISPEENKLPKLVKVFNLKGKLQYEFGDMFDYKDNWISVWANWLHFDVDDAYFYLSFRYQNRIEKYSLDGKLLWKADRKLNYSTKPLDKGLRAKNRQDPKMNTVSTGIAPDEKGRVWVVTLTRQERRDETSVAISGGNRRTIKIPDEASEKTDIYKLEVFNSDGILLGEIKLNHHAHGIRILQNYLFTWERNHAKYHQYEIIEK